MALPLRVPSLVTRCTEVLNVASPRRDVGVRKGCCRDITKPALLSVNRIVKTGYYA